MNLKNFCKIKGITLKQVAEELGVSLQAVSQWSTGETIPTFENFYKLLSVLDISPDEMKLSRPLFFPKALAYPRKYIKGIMMRVDKQVQHWTDAVDI